MLVTSAAIPVAAVWHRARGQWRHWSAQPWPPPLRAVLFDRDGTLVHDVPYNGNPDLVKPVDGAAEALESLRRNGVRIGVLTNQSGVGRGLVSRAAVDAVNARVDGLLGPFDIWQVCPRARGRVCVSQTSARHGAGRGSRPGPRPRGLRGGRGHRRRRGGRPRGGGARRARANGADRPQEVRDSPVVATDLVHAVALLLGSRR